MRILFIARRFSYLKNFEGPILQLARRGHQLHLVALGAEGKLEGTAIVERWAEQESRISYERIPPVIRESLKMGVRGSIAMMRDYLRYLQPQYGAADGLVKRARQRTPLGFLRLVETRYFRWRRLRQAMLWVLGRMEAAAPRSLELDAYLCAQAPDAVLFTPLIGLQSAEQDVLKAAVEQGLRTVFCVLSWDNLSSKAIIRQMPDLVMVWNEVQRDEARILHGVPADRIAITGAQTFDHWFNREPSRTRAEFLARVGLPTDRPFLLWVCSSLFRSSPVEARFVRRWIEAIRNASDPQLRDVSILVRPHPARMPEWARVRIDDLGPVSLWGSLPVDVEARNDYFDSLYYSQAVVGLNTSAFLEAAIVGRPVYTILLPEYHESQEGTLHFPYLLNVAGGLLHAARDMETHLADLAAALRRQGDAAERSRRFVEAFIRPRGVERSASDEFADAIEQLMRRPAQRPPVQRTGVVLASLYAWLERHSQRDSLKQWLTSQNVLTHRAELEAKREKAREREAERRRSKEEAMRQHRAAKRLRRERVPETRQ